MFCKIDIEEDSECKKCCKLCKLTCERKCIFAKRNAECNNQVKNNNSQN
jgi:hypothetical protein